MSQAIEILTPVGRLVGGHPITRRVVTDNDDKPKMGADGVTPLTETYFAIAIPKAGEAHWNQTEWGAKIHQAAQTGWPNGEFNSPTFSWKVLDGDSQVPNTKGKKPCDREGWPGHWVLHLSTMMLVKAYHAGKYDPTQQIQDEKAIKPGDYCRAVLNAKGNAPAKSPGVYLNPSLFELTSAGVEIQLGDGPAASEAFGGSAPQLPAGAQTMAAPATAPAPAPTPAPATAPAPAPTPAPAPAPAPDFLNGAPAPAPVEPLYLVNGTQYTADQLRAAGWNDQQIAGAQRAN